MINDGKEIMKSNSKLSEVYEKFKDQDGFLYILYTGENVFGWMPKYKYWLINIYLYFLYLTYVYIYY